MLCQLISNVEIPNNVIVNTHQAEPFDLMNPMTQEKATCDIT